jgi:hypothetical protein
MEKNIIIGVLILILLVTIEIDNSAICAEKDKMISYLMQPTQTEKDIIPKNLPMVPIK